MHVQQAAGRRSVRARVVPKNLKEEVISDLKPLDDIEVRSWRPCDGSRSGCCRDRPRKSGGHACYRRNTVVLGASVPGGLYTGCTLLCTQLLHTSAGLQRLVRWVLHMGLLTAPLAAARTWAHSSSCEGCASDMRKPPGLCTEVFMCTPSFYLQYRAGLAQGHACQSRTPGVLHKSAAGHRSLPCTDLPRRCSMLSQHQSSA